ncbi:hypothetical protein B0H14DRAFT_396747 [Mycena olivaceomarginata]|nr:hypothetical protein B0H14DRAFT_396747 [Mycena olivaceomarginata]
MMLPPHRPRHSPSRREPPPRRLETSSVSTVSDTATETQASASASVETSDSVSSTEAATTDVTPRPRLLQRLEGARGTARPARAASVQRLRPLAPAGAKVETEVRSIRAPRHQLSRPQPPPPLPRRLGVVASMSPPISARSLPHWVAGSVAFWAGTAGTRAGTVGTRVGTAGTKAGTVGTRAATAAAKGHRPQPRRLSLRTLRPLRLARLTLLLLRTRARVACSVAYHRSSPSLPSIPSLPRSVPASPPSWVGSGEGRAGRVVTEGSTGPQHRMLRPQRLRARRPRRTKARVVCSVAHHRSSPSLLSSIPSLPKSVPA